MERKKAGRKSKGPRKQVNFYLPLDLHQAAQDKASQLGMTFTDFVAELLAERTGVPYTLNSQEALRLSA